MLNRACVAIAILLTAANALRVNKKSVDGLTVAGSTKKMPLNGFGTCCRATAKGPPLIKATKAYLANGGRLIDTAQLYQNHKDLKVAMKESGVPREDIWVTSKVNTALMGPFHQTEQSTLKSVDTTLQELGLDYLDLMLIHGAWANSDDQLAGIWTGLIKAKKAGKIKSIGIANFNKEQIETLTAKTGEQPAVLQLEYHPWVQNNTHQLVQWAQSKGIAVTAYGSLGSSANKDKGEAVGQVAEKHNATSAQVLLKWALRRGCAVIPGSNSENHIKENLAANDFELEEDDVTFIETSKAPHTWKRWKNCKKGSKANLPLVQGTTCD